MRYIYMLIPPYDAGDLIYAKKDNTDDKYFYDKTLSSLQIIEGIDSYILLHNGVMSRVTKKNIDSLKSNRNAIIKLSIEKLRDENIDTIYSSFVKETMDRRDSLSTLAQKDANKYKLEYLSVCMMLTSAYIIVEDRLDELKDDKEANDEMVQAIIEERENEIEEHEIENELDMLNAMIKECIPKDKRNDLQIESCTYNGKSMTQEEIVNKLSSHMLPEFMTQVNILDTLEDQYEIVTNNYIITREKGGEISIKEK